MVLIRGESSTPSAPGRDPGAAVYRTMAGRHGPTTESQQEASGAIRAFLHSDGLE
jgi:hypothetical protein